MIELAYLNQDLLEKKWKSCLTSNLFFYYFHSPAMPYKIEIVNSEWNTIQYVSKDSENKIIGFFAGYINRTHNFVENLDIINFTEKINVTFTEDLFEFFYLLLIKKGFRKIVFHAIKDNPAAKMYERFIIRNKIGVVVGTLKKNKLLPDGKYYDEIIFEVYKEWCIEYNNKLPENRRRGKK
jgi:hypothetical protein